MDTLHCKRIDMSFASWCSNILRRNDGMMQHSTMRYEGGWRRV
eukprot:CAMPEP_0202907848 /NCGR_PEP_ID=MMETSP1392-20130828/44051_1 /ASSEMBLY_ACC=CAM_ASM_000868 /TAXON_ID=225041 /ORGANISM="Chlamydomonas chlamydogama, Strain SAG 11-48b" /LENGTH=42 /DNA_ID= /DNA_START= /DNA_END= /DNA_ORIENTATION=